MEATVTIGWWALPLLVSAVVFGWALLTPPEKATGASAYGYSFPDPMPLVRMEAAAFIALVAWLVWAVIV